MKAGILLLTDFRNSFHVVIIRLLVCGTTGTVLLNIMFYNVPCCSILSNIIDSPINITGIFLQEELNKFFLLGHKMSLPTFRIFGI